LGLVALTVSEWSALSCLVAVTFLSLKSPRFPATPDVTIPGLQELLLFILLLLLLLLLLLFNAIAFSLGGSNLYTSTDETKFIVCKDFLF